MSNPTHPDETLERPDSSVRRTKCTEGARLGTRFRARPSKPCLASVGSHCTRFARRFLASPSRFRISSSVAIRALLCLVLHRLEGFAVE